MTLESLVRLRADSLLAIHNVTMHMFDVRYLVDALLLEASSIYLDSLSFCTGIVVSINQVFL
jgi:hypothetical protein